jgi:alpha-2-macroglobulin
MTNDPIPNPPERLRPEDNRRLKIRPPHLTPGCSVAAGWSVAAGTFLLLALAGIFLILRGRLQPPPTPQPIPLDTEVSSILGESQAMANSTGGENLPARLTLHLSEGQAQPQTAAPLPLATGQPLPQADLERLLERLPILTPEPQDVSEFNLAPGPIPPPRPGQTIQQPFPPAVQPAPTEAVESGPLKVLRYAPEGEIPIAPFINITFNQPMVALDTLGDLAIEQVPVHLEPSLPGAWRWLGTRTLTFEYDSDLIDRLPKATRYQVTIPAGTTSATGGVLAETVEWNFSTPPPKATFTYPADEPQALDPLFLIAFDQRIDPAAVLATIQVSAAGQRVALRLASEAEVQADGKLSGTLKNTPEGRWLAFRAQSRLPADAQVQVTIGPGTPSAEGPLLSEQAQSYGFHTYAALRITEHGCYYGGDQCRPLSPFYIRFNNPLDASNYTEDMLHITPELPGASVNLIGDTIQIRGTSKGQTSYTVTISGDLQDTFGQKLGKDARLTFQVGPAQPALTGPGQTLVTLDPASKKPLFSVYALNYPRLDVKVYAVQPSDWPDFQTYLRNYQRTDAGLKVPGRLVLDRTLPVEAPADTLSQVDIDLSPYLDGAFGQFIVIVQPPGGSETRHYWQTVQAWVQVTQIGLDAFNDYSQMVAWTSALKDGAPLAGTNLTAWPSGYQTTTGEDGIARFPIPDGTAYLVARRGADQALLPRSTYFWGQDTWNPAPPNDTLRWYVFDDRQMYRPGEEVHIKGWLRRVGSKQDGDVGLAGDAISTVRYQLIDPQGNDLGGGRAEVNLLGGFDFATSLPQQVNLGYARLQLSAEGDLSGLDGFQYFHSFQIQEFRRPEFEVTARNESNGPYFAGGNAVVAVKASYYAGGPLPNADVTWQVTSAPGRYSPPNWPDFTFGTWTPWWTGGPAYKFGSYGPGNNQTQVETFSGKTDASGTHYLRLDFDQGGESGPAAIHQPVSLVAQATVMDVNRQAWTGSTSLLVHPANLYVGLRSPRIFVERGTPIQVDFIVTDLDGNPVADKAVEVRAARLEWKYQENNWREVEADVQTCNLGSALEPLTCSFETPLGGSYRISAVVSDDQGRRNQSELTRWVSGGELPPARQVQQEALTLIPDKESYRPGDVAQILVQLPGWSVSASSPAEGLLTVSRSGILYTQRFRIEQDSITLQVPIEEKYTPNLSIQVDVNGATPRNSDQGKALPDIPPRPAFASGQLGLSIPPLQRQLSLLVTPEQSELEPGGETALDLVVKDANGEPVPNAELAVVVVDEAILALSNYQLADPLLTFYSYRPAGLSSLYGRASIVLADPQALAQSASLALERGAVAEAPAAMATMAPSATQMAADAGGLAPGAAPEPIRVRVDFNPLAVFAPQVRTDASGQARLSVKLPDNLTRYRVMVVAVDQGNQFGMGEANLVARLPLMMRPSAPRFLNFGDHFELPVVLQNQTGEPMLVDVALQASNIMLTGDQGLRVSVPAHDRVEVRFPAAAAMPGTARIQVAAIAGDFADAATVELPVYTPATTEAFATYGVLDQGAVAQPVAAPNGVIPQYGGLEISTSSTALQTLSDAVLYLIAYPFECSEQLASRVLAVAALRDVLTAFNAPGLPSPAVMEAAVQRDIGTLQGLQNADGGFPYWRRGQDSIPFNTIHVAHALYRAGAKGFTVPAGMQTQVMEYLRQIESHYPAWYSRQTRWTLGAYALYVRNLMGDQDPNKALRLLDEAGMENLSLDALGWLWPVLEGAPNTSARVDEIRRYINNHAVETAGAANFTTSYDDQNYLLLGSNRRTDAILLDALIGDNAAGTEHPMSDLIPKLVNGLLAQRTRGRWMNTQENVFVLLALDRYFNAYEAQTPDFVANIWLGSAYAGEQQFSGRSTDRYQMDVPMSYLVDPTQNGGTQNLILSKDGPGRLYYRLGLSYAPSDLRLDALDMGFIVQRSYEAVDNPEDVSQDESGTWHIKAGARVRVHLTMVADNRRYHVALVDPLPAGLEIVNPGLAVSGSIPQDLANGGSETRSYMWWGPWYEHQNLRDERAEAFTSLLWEGVYQYTYIARATTPGTFVAPPAKAEEMYSPEVFGRSASDIVYIK